MPTAIFERQDQARMRTWMLIGVFALVVAGLLFLVNTLLLFMVHPQFLPGLSAPSGQPAQLSEGIADARGLMTGFSLVLLALMGGAMLRMVLRLRSGGRVIAQDLGGEPVKADSDDPGERRLRNVVEEMALAAGVITPGVYVLREEPGINAFAAGLTPADSVVAVTRGALDKLTRDELQGVVAHEIGHIVNGDTRLNSWLLAIVHGLEAVAIQGTIYMSVPRHGRGSHRRAPGVTRDRDPHGAGTLAFGVSMYLLGLLGVFCSRLVKAAIVRQREWLADAAAMQYARYPEGLAGALKKVAAGRRLGSALLASRRQEVSHMLFAPGLGFADAILPLLSTHPPVEERISALEPRYRSWELDDVRQRMNELMQQRQAERQRGEPDIAADAMEDTGDESRVPSALRGGPLNDAVLLSTLAAAGQAETLGLRRNRAELVGVARPLHDAATDPARVRSLAVYLLLADDVEARRRQLEEVTATLGDAVHADVLALLAEYGRLPTPAHRLPLLELALPVLTDLPEAHRARLLAAVGRLLRCNGGPRDVHEYAVSRLLQLQLMGDNGGDAGEPMPMHACMDEAALVLGLLASHGCPEDPEGAYQAGMAAMLVPSPPSRQVPDAWIVPMTRALNTLAALDADGRQNLTRGLAAAAAHAGEVSVAEAELLRVIVVALHLPVPLILPTDAMSGVSGEASAEAE